MSTPRKSFTTKKGTELSILNLKGREYLMAAQRIQWFREENPNGIIKTQLIANGGEGLNEFYVFKAEVYVENEKGPMLIATAHKRETKQDFPDALEKCETSAIARCLALAGYGTQFTADELDEGNRLADAPITILEKVKASAPVVAEKTTTANGAAPLAKKSAGFAARMRRTNTGV